MVCSSAFHWPYSLPSLSFPCLFPVFHSDTNPKATIKTKTINLLACCYAQIVIGNPKYRKFHAGATRDHFVSFGILDLMHLLHLPSDGNISCFLSWEFVSLLSQLYLQMKNAKFIKVENLFPIESPLQPPTCLHVPATPLPVLIQRLCHFHHLLVIALDSECSETQHIFFFPQWLSTIDESSNNINDATWNTNDEIYGRIPSFVEQLS